MVDLKQVVSREGGKRIQLRIRMSLNQDSLLIETLSDMTVEMLKNVLAKILSKKPENILLCSRGWVFLHGMCVKEVTDMIRPEGIIENLPTGNFE